MRKGPPKIIGLTGGIASGKTLVSDHLASKGFDVIDTDVIARDLLDRDRETRAKILEKLGTTDRAELRAIVFENPRKRKLLERIMHPRIWSEVEHALESIARRESKTPLVFVVVPLLFETKSESRYDETLSILSSRALQTRRLLQREGMTPKLARAILAAQTSSREKARRSDHVIWNRTTKRALLRAVDRWLKGVSYSAGC